MRAKPVVEIMSFRSTFGGHSDFYVCPACHVILELGFIACCGQHLDQRKYRDAKVIPARR